MRHRVLIVGAGSIGERHLRCFQATGRADIVLVEKHPERCRRVAERHGVRRAFTDVADSLAEPIDAAVIATPAPFHVSQATELARRGIHLLIEKPLSTSMLGIAALQEAVQTRGLTAAVAYVYRCHPLLAAMRQALLDGRFGKPLELIVVAGQHFPTYRPAYRDIYYIDRAMGGGAIQDALTHLVNAGEWLVGPVDRLVVDAAHQSLEGVTVEDTVHLLARHGAVMGSYSLNQYQAPNETTLTVICERGAARFELHESRWRWLTEISGTWNNEGGETMERDTMFIAQAHAFLDAVESNRPVPCTLQEGVQTLRVNLAALTSMDQGNWQTITR
ncbi:MAG: Gfo/Idh/MocA family oxidoreductase [Planctomycetes bacterium]|nr:Gfo/Idh/MocA family oxidoreductase [Planctomycetota bacterium]